MDITRERKAMEATSYQENLDRQVNLGVTLTVKEIQGRITRSTPPLGTLETLPVVVTGVNGEVWPVIDASWYTCQTCGQGEFIELVIDD
jgi:hypothetical protein